MTSHEVIRRLEADGWFRIRQRGSHIQFKHATKKGKVTVPHPKKDMTIRTVKSIEKQSGLSLL
ncbi:MAG: type II toxin-antitoxin system HicA family toxin [Desulfomonile tiedjei]|nr:type II toxin-antitoxin system HicA family toxin [Desulfomonile tiedjei]